MVEYDLKNADYVFVWGGLLKDAGGMTRVMLDRLCIFKRMGLNVKVLLGGKDKRQYDAVQIYQEHGYPEIAIDDFLCMEDWLASKYADMNADIISELQDEGMIFGVRKENTQDIFYQGILVGKCYYENDDLIKIENYNLSGGDNKVINSVDYYYKNIKYKTNRQISVTERMEHYYANNGFCFMTCYYKDGKEQGVKLFDQKKRVVNEYNGSSELREFFFSQYVMENQTRDMFVICDPILDFEPGFRYMEEAKGNKLYKIAINHGIGFAIPRNWNSGCNPRFQRYLNVNSSELDALIILTEAALSNIKKRFGNRNIFKCIPNKVDLNPIRNSVTKRNKNKAVFVGRFSEEKQCVQVVKAFEKVVKEFPEAILELYGRGDTETSIVEEIKKHSLEKNVFVKGFSRNVQEVFSDARLSIVSSEYTFESFCLSLVESLASGCPVVTYEMKFGAAYVIENGYNGYLTKADDIDMLAENIKRVYRMSEDELEKLSINAYESAKIFSPHVYEEKWIDLLEEVVAQKEVRTNVMDMCIEIDSIKYSIEEQKTSLFGKITLQGDVPKSAEALIRIYARDYCKDKCDYVINEGRYLEVKEGCYSFEVDLGHADTPTSICFECTNTFIEKEITDLINKALGISA